MEKRKRWIKIKNYYFPKGLTNEWPYDKDDPADKEFFFRFKVPKVKECMLDGFIMVGKIESAENQCDDYPFSVLDRKGNYHSLELFDYYMEV